MTKKTDISNQLYEYAIAFGVHEHEALQELRQETAKLPNAHMQITRDQAQFMGLLAKITQAKHYMEIGVFTGYSSLAMALAMGENSEVVGLENNKDYLNIAKQFWDRAQVANRIKIIEGDALNSCAELITSDYNNYFDIIFIDADRKNCLTYYEYCYKLVKPGGLILIDNVLFHGQVLQDNPPEFVQAIQELNKLIYNDTRVEISLLPIADGLTIVYKK